MFMMIVWEGYVNHFSFSFPIVYYMVFIQVILNGASK